MTYKQQICNRIIEKMEWWREAKWADYIDLHTKDAVITVMENVVDGIANMRQSRYEKDADRWIPCSERLPEINQTVLLSTTDGEVIVGYRYNPDIVWQVTANDGRKIWVYDPENYPGNIDELPKAETCGFEDRDNCWLSVTSINYDLKFAGISAWMPLPEPYKEEEQNG